MKVSFSILHMTHSMGFLPGTFILIFKRFRTIMHFSDLKISLTNNELFLLTESNSFKLDLSAKPGGYYNYNDFCDEPYYMEYNQTNQQKILQLMNKRNISSVWLYINRVDLKGWRWFSGEKYSKFKLLLTNIIV